MKKAALLIAATLAAMSIAATASAAATVSNFDGSSGIFADSGITGAFTDTYTFDSDAGLFDLTLSTASKGITFSNINFDGQDLQFIGIVGGSKYYGLNSVAVSSGPQTLIVDGKYMASPQYKSGSYSGTVAFTATSAAPEPVTWALLMIGVGGIGLTLRQAKKNNGSTFARALAA